MKCEMAAIALAGAGLMACSNAWSWAMDGDTNHFNIAERNFCSSGGTDAAAIMFSRQMGTPLSYPDDEIRPPSEQAKNVRSEFVRYAESYPIESTEEKKMAVADKFSKDMRRGCLLYINLTRPEEFMCRSSDLILS